MNPSKEPLASRGDIRLLHSTHLAVCVVSFLEGKDRLELVLTNHAFERFKERSSAGYQDSEEVLCGLKDALDEGEPVDEDGEAIYWKSNDWTFVVRKDGDDWIIATTYPTDK